MFHAQIPFDRIPHQFKSGPMCRSSQGESIINIIRACVRCFKDNIFIPRAPFKKFLDCRWFSINYFKIMLNYFLEKSECLIHKDIFKRTFPCAACCGNSSVIAWRWVSRQWLTGWQSACRIWVLVLGVRGRLRTRFTWRGCGSSQAWGQLAGHGAHFHWAAWCSEHRPLGRGMQLVATHSFYFILFQSGSSPGFRGWAEESRCRSLSESCYDLWWKWEIQCR